MSRLNDVILAIDNDLGGQAKNVKNTPSIRFYKNNPLKLNIVINLAQELTNNEKEQLILTLFRTI